MRMGGLSAPAALDNSGTDATPASNPIFSFANAMKRASSVPAGTVSAARGGAGGCVGEAAGVGCGWVAMILPAGIITPACAGWQTSTRPWLLPPAPYFVSDTQDNPKDNEHR